MDQERVSGAERLPKESYREAKEGQREAREGQRKASGAKRRPKKANRWPQKASSGVWVLAGPGTDSVLAGPGGLLGSFSKADKKQAKGKESKKRDAVDPKHA